ncbi:MAG TPA: SDR family oxidoreductase [Polyangia bacterium]|jgi:citronellol/citronellal dehydrogenase|nr:SDR family oxidoreductase [Polyangia bacterium]
MFAGKVAFVTGASRGVGKAIALTLARNGCDVVVAAKTVAPDPRLPGTVGATAREVEALGRRALPLALDVRDDVAVERSVKAALDKLGRVDFLVNNAGALYWQSLADTPLKKFDLVMDVNVRGAFACTHHVLPAMRAQKFGHVLMMSPPVDLDAATGKVAYAISKFGMTLIARGLAEEVRDDNVAANALWPVTMIESLATINWGLGDRTLWRKPDILADATLRIFAKEPRSFTGHALLDEDFLRSEGITDFTGYRCDPAHEPPRIGFDFRAATPGKNSAPA